MVITRTEALTVAQMLLAAGIALVEEATRDTAQELSAQAYVINHLKAAVGTEEFIGRGETPTVAALVDKIQANGDDEELGEFNDLVGRKWDFNYIQELLEVEED